MDTILKFAATNTGSYIKNVSLKVFKLAKDLTTNVNWGDSSISSKQWSGSINYAIFKHEYSINLTAAAVSVDNTISHFDYNGTTVAAKHT